MWCIYFYILQMCSIFASCYTSNNKATKNNLKHQIFTTMGTRLLTKRALDLMRDSKVTAIESKSILLEVGQSEEFDDILDIQTYQRIRTRFNRLKRNEGIVLSTNLDGSKLTVTRKEDV
jgi:hypothetical protein